MGRALRSKSDRRDLWEAQGGRCATCGCDLGPWDSNWHADHWDEPWKTSRRTNVFEMRALCPSCNLRKGACVTSAGPGEKSMVPGKFDGSKLRIAQVDAIATGQRCLADGKSVTLLQLPTRYGKSLIMRVLAWWILATGHASKVVALSFARNLRDQLGDLKRWRKAEKLCRLDRQFRPEIRVDAPSRMVVADGDLLSTTIHMFASQRRHWDEWFDHVKYQQGRSPVVFVDECHMLGNGLQFGRLVRSLSEKGIQVVMLTATPIRHDGQEIPGCVYESDPEESFSRVAFAAGSAPEMVRIQRIEGTRAEKHIKPDFVYSFADAWGEKPAPMCDISHYPIDVSLRGLVELEGDRLMLSEASPTLAREVLGQVVRSPDFIALAVAEFVATLRAMRRADGRIQGMVFAAAKRDEEEPDEQHIAALVAAVRALAPELDVVTATMDDDDAAERIVRFAGQPEAEPPVLGRGDVLVLKSMGGVGLDAPQVKVVLDASPTRSFATSVQRWMRGATVFGGWQTFRLIGPADILARENIDLLTDNRRTGFKSVTAEEIVEEYERPRRETPEPRGGYEVDGATVWGARDNRGRQADSEHARAAARLLEGVPSLRKFLTDAQLAGMLANDPSIASAIAAAAPSSPRQPELPIHEDKERRRSELEGYMQRLRAKRFGQRPPDQAEMGRQMGKVWTEAKGRARVPHDIEVAKYSVEQLAAVRAAAIAMLGE